MYSRLETAKGRGIIEVDTRFSNDRAGERNGLCLFDTIMDSAVKVNFQKITVEHEHSTSLSSKKG